MLSPSSLTSSSASCSSSASNLYSRVPPPRSMFLLLGARLLCSELHGNPGRGYSMPLWPGIRYGATARVQLTVRSLHIKGREGGDNHNPGFWLVWLSPLPTLLFGKGIAGQYTLTNIGNESNSGHARALSLTLHADV